MSERGKGVTGGVEQMLDTENQRATEVLSSKVSRLKSDQQMPQGVQLNNSTIRVFENSGGTGSELYHNAKNTIWVQSILKFALEIDKETEEHNQYLDGMDSEFMSVTGLLSGSVKRFSSMVRSGRDNRRLTCYLVAALVISFLVLYYLVWRVRT